ncbi:MAG: hypothetical protein AAGC60_16750 [Acidobacteriota bacterium]
MPFKGLFFDPDPELRIDLAVDSTGRPHVVWQRESTGFGGGEMGAP